MKRENKQLKQETAMKKETMLKKLEKAGISMNGIDFQGSNSIVVTVDYVERNGYGNCNREKTNRLANKVAKAIGWQVDSWTQFGGAIVTAAPKSRSALRGFADPMHY
jgi:AICAR transformylase/IMP cyclohydrolase PurH